MSRICIVPGKLQGIGGPASFQRKLTAGLAQRGIDVTYDLSDEPYDAVLVINGTSQLGRLWRCKKRGIRIVQRLGGIHYLHRYLPVGLRGYLLAEARNLIMRLVRLYMADHIVYQSCFVRDWWNKRYGAARVPSTVVYNGVDLEQFNPQGPKYLSGADVCIISVEGTQGADPFNIAIRLAQGFEEKGLKTELLVFGNPWKDAQSYFSQHHFVKFMGQVPNSELPYFYRGATFYISTDIIAACPNSVLEALACGTPVLGYEAGVLPELLNGSAGRCVECHGDPRKGEPPGNLGGMVSAALELIGERERLSLGARMLAEKRYDLDRMSNAYCEVLLR